MDRLFFGGDIITMTGKEIDPEAVLVSDGKICFVGALKEAEQRAGADIERVDLQGKTLMPSFLDGHGHVSVAAQMARAADLSSCNSFHDIEETLKKYLREHPQTSDGVVIGFGYDHNFLAEKGHPGRRVLDKVSKEIPIYISHISGHMACVNSRLLHMAGITAETADPEGGIIGRESGTGEPDGYLEEGAMVLMQTVMAGRVKMDTMACLKSVQEQYLQYGVTTVQDGASGKDTVAVMKQACASGRFDLDVVSYPVLGQGQDAEGIFAANPECDGNYFCHFKLGGYKAILDGSPQGKSAWLTKPYVNSGNYCAYPWFSDEAVRGFMETALRDRKQILVHCNGDAAGDQFLNAYAAALEKYPEAAAADLRPVMIHCQTAREDQLDRMAQLGMIPSVFVGHVYYWGDVHLENLGTERASRISPCRSAAERGLPINFHQDTPVTKPDMMHSVWAAVNRVTRSGVLLGEEQTVDVYEALKAVTINTAYAYHEENMKGTVEAGKTADLVVLAENPLTADRMKLKDILVEETIKDGVTLYRRQR